jgi:hypothetical protein
LKASPQILLKKTTDLIRKFCDHTATIGWKANAAPKRSFCSSLRFDSGLLLLKKGLTGIFAKCCTAVKAALKINVPVPLFAIEEYAITIEKVKRIDHFMMTASIK